MKNLGTAEGKRPEEKFQNETLRPIIKMQHDLLLAFFKNYLIKKKIDLSTESTLKKNEVISKIFKGDNLFKTELRGLIIGHFTVAEYSIYRGMAPEINKRILSIVKERLISLNLLIFFILLSLFSTQSFAQVTQTGTASFYSDTFEGKKTASGEVYKASKMTAAHPTLAFGTRIKVTNVENKRSVVVTVNDRGPFAKGRIIDLSRAAAVKLDFIDDGVAKVRLEVLK